MSHQEFYFVEPADVKPDSLIIRGTEYKHLVQVLRKKVGDSAIATDGQGNAYDFFITKIDKDKLYGQIQKKRRRVGEPLFKLTLAQAILKGNHFDWIVEKGTEIGVTQIIPVVTERTIALAGNQKMKRFRRIAQESMKQCCRSIIPAIKAPMHLSEVLDYSSKFTLKLIAHADRKAVSLRFIVNDNSLLTPTSTSRNGILLIGPEGGFTAAEVRAAEDKGFHKISLGKRRLRAESAGVVATTLLLDKMGEF